MDNAADFQLSRRLLLGALGVAGATALVATDTSLANAAPSWGHPFTFRSGWSRGLEYSGSTITHEGVDYTPGLGTEIRAIAPGRVTFSSSSWGSGGAYGEGVIVDHGDGWTSRYAHMQPGTRVGSGGYVERGAYLGRVGSTGRSTGPHLHLEIRQNGAVRDALALTRNAPLAGTSSPPAPPAPEPQPEPIVLEDVMIRISAPNRGVAIIGPGYYRQLNSNEEVEQAGAIVHKTLEGNDRQFDLWKSMAVSGQSAASI